MSIFILSRMPWTKNYESIPFYLFFAHCSRCKAVPQRFLVTNHLKYLGEDMALAFANRSALYFRQKKFQSSLSDTRLALKCGYPKHLKYKVLQRQAKCLYELGHFKDAKHSYRHKIKLSLYTLRMTGTKCFVLSQRKRKLVTVILSPSRNFYFYLFYSVNLGMQLVSWTFANWIKIKSRMFSMTSNQAWMKFRWSFKIISFWAKNHLKNETSLITIMSSSNMI